MRWLVALGLVVLVWIGIWLFVALGGHESVTEPVLGTEALDTLSMEPTAETIAVCMTRVPWSGPPATPPEPPPCTPTSDGR